jgi:hypothetical protein
MKIQDYAPIAIAFVLIGVVLGVGADVLDNVEDNFTDNTTAQLSVANATEGVGELASWLPIVGLVVAAALVIGILFNAFSGIGRSN